MYYISASVEVQCIQPKTVIFNHFWFGFLKKLCKYSAVSWSISPGDKNNIFA